VTSKTTIAALACVLLAGCCSCPVPSTLRSCGGGGSVESRPDGTIVRVVGPAEIVDIRTGETLHLRANEVWTP